MDVAQLDEDVVPALQLTRRHRRCGSLPEPRHQGRTPGTVRLEPGDEVIVSPWTMSASATAILVWNAIPVFADIEDQTFNLDPASIERNINSRTKAIMVTDIFGHAADMDPIMDIARKHGLKVVEDCAQAPGAFYRGRYAGTIADIGVFSLNYHKHIHTGEGGVCVTNDDDLAERMQLIRNHAEAVVGDKGVNDLSNMIGFNLRMTEIEAAIGIEQLKKLKKFAGQRTRAADRLTEQLLGLDGLRTPVVKEGCTHVYYVYPMVLDVKALGCDRATLYRALVAEGIPNLFVGYTLVHQLPMYQRKIAYGSKGYPWTTGFCRDDICYDLGICPVAERLHAQTHLGTELCISTYIDEEVDQVAKAFRKVWGNLDQLR